MGVRVLKVVIQHRYAGPAGVNLKERIASVYKSGRRSQPWRFQDVLYSQVRQS